MLRLLINDKVQKKTGPFTDGDGEHYKRLQLKLGKCIIQKAGAAFSILNLLYFISPTKSNIFYFSKKTIWKRAKIGWLLRDVS